MKACLSLILNTKVVSFAFICRSGWALKIGIDENSEARPCEGQEWGWAGFPVTRLFGFSLVDFTRVS